jgi:predicted amidohydrolase YtcJ
MSLRLLQSALFIAGALIAAFPARAAERPPAADIVFENGRIYTVDAVRSWAEAIAIRDGRIHYVGTNAGVESWIGDETRVVDLHGRMMLPGLHDAHIHPIAGGIEALACDLNALPSLDAYLERIRECATRDPDKPWVTGGGWLMSVFGPGANASRALLDEIVPDRPVYLSSADGHSAWVNSRALEIAGIDAETPDPPDGIIDREPNSRVPLGSLQEGAMYLVEQHMPPATLESRIAGLEYAMDMLNGYGITSIQDANVGDEELDAYRAMLERGDLSLRVVGAQWWERHSGIEQIAGFVRRRSEFATGRLRATTVKIMQDGVMENFTAALLEPYVDQDGRRGIPMIEPETLNLAVTRLDAAGFQVHFHAIGDAAIRQSLDAVESARRANGELGNRHHISHLQLIDPQDISRFRDLGVVANFQPLWAYADAYVTDLTEPFIGPERSGRMYPIASILESGAVVAFGSDWSVSSANPYQQMEVAITRLGPLGETDEPLAAGEAVGVADAIAAFTIAGAWVNGQEADTGSIETGKYADLVVLDRNLFTIPPADISETEALVTLLEGEVVHGSLGAL